MPKDFTVSIPPDQLAKKLVEAGIPASQFTGTIEQSGVEFAFTYNNSQQVLNVEIQKKPVFAPYDYIEKKVREWLAS
jgi:hypothetical protein